MESKVNKSSLLCCRECWSKIQGFCNIHEEYDLLWRRGPLCSGGVKGKIRCNSWFLAEGEWLWGVGGRQNSLNKQEVEEMLWDELCQCSLVIWAVLSLEDSLQLVCACLACRNELSDAFVLPSAFPGVALALGKSRHGRGEQGIQQECCCCCCWHACVGTGKDGWWLSGVIFPKCVNRISCGRNSEQAAVAVHSVS